MPEQPAADADGDLFFAAPDGEGRDQVEQDVVVVAGIERDPALGPGRDEPRTTSSVL